MTTASHQLVVVIASAIVATAESAADSFRREGWVAYSAHSWEGCLRVATSVTPDLVLLDDAMPPRVESLPRAHPTCSHASIERIGSRSARQRRDSSAPLPVAA
jgi:CheY-like chemotaxis protein